MSLSFFCCLISPLASSLLPLPPSHYTRARAYTPTSIYSRTRTHARTHKQASSSRSLPRHRASSTPSHPSRRPRLPSWPAAATPTPTACSTPRPPPAPPSALPSRPPPEPAAPSSQHTQSQTGWSDGLRRINTLWLIWASGL